MEVKDIKLNTEGTVTNTRNMHCCLMKDQHFYSFLICVTSMLYYLAVGITAVVGSMLINQKIAGNYDHPNSQSVFTDVTSSFLFSAASMTLYSSYYQQLINTSDMCHRCSYDKI